MPALQVESGTNGRGSYILNSRDLCLMPELDSYLKIGVDSLKVSTLDLSKAHTSSTVGGEGVDCNDVAE